MKSFKQSALPAVAFLAVTGGSNAIAQSNLAEAQSEIEEVLVLGSRVPGRSAQDLPVAVDSLSSQDLLATGQTEVGRMLQTLAPSFNFSSSSISDGTDALRPATLRGLGPDQTLVLVNGKRRHQASLIHINTSVGRGTAGTDLNAIPGVALRDIEILRDGAAAQYGSDAIAGVINLQLEDDPEVSRIRISYGGYSKGDGETTNIDLVKGFALGDSGFLTAALNYRDRGFSNRANPQGGCLYGGCVDTDSNGFSEPAAGNQELEVNGPARDGFRIGDAESEQVALVLNAGMSLGAGELYGFVTYSRRDNESGAFHRNPHGSNGVNDALLRDGLNPADTNGFLPIIQSDINDFSVNFGYRNEFDNGATIDLSYTSGANSIDYTTQNSANYSFANLLQFGRGLSDDEIRATIPREAFAYGLELELETLNLDLTQQYGNLALALGAELRSDTYRIIAGEEYSYFDFDTDPDGASLFAQDAGGGIQGFNGIAPESEVDETRDVISFYLDGEYQINDNWLVTGAVRYDDYDGFGDTINFKLASNYQILNNLRIRGAVSTGFRAPSMQQLFFNNISTQIREAGAVTVGTFRNDSDVVRALGVPELKEEESDNFSIGLVANVTEKWNLTVDYYRINIDDRIAISNQLSTGDDPLSMPGAPGPLEAALIAADAQAAQFFLNGANTKTTGWDIVSTWTGIDVANGNLNLTLAANFTDTDVTSIFVPVSGALAGLNPDVVFSSQDISIIEEWQPQDRISFIAAYNIGALSVNLGFQRYGKYTIVDGESQTYGSEILTDLNLNYDFGNGLNLFFNGNNIFGVTPDETTNTSTRGGDFESAPGAADLASPTVFRFSRRAAPFGFNGAYFSAGVSYDF